MLWGRDVKGERSRETQTQKKRVNRDYLCRPQYRYTYWYSVICCDLSVHGFINGVSMVTKVPVSRLEVAQRVTLSLISAYSCIQLSVLSQLPVSPPPHSHYHTGMRLAHMLKKKICQRSFPAYRKTKLFLCNEIQKDVGGCHWDLKQEEHVLPLSFSSCGVMVSGTSAWSMSFSLAMMCFTRQLAASSMLMFS